MSTVVVKICGLSEPETLEAALGAGADMIGLVSFQKSPRHVELSTMGALANQARGRAEIVVLTVDATDAHLSALDDAVKPDWWQLHGREDESRVKSVRAKFGQPVMKALGIGSAEDTISANGFVGIADRILLDAKPPKDATRPGGLGAVFDWSLLDALDRSQPFMLSGGLNPSNVGDAIVATSAPGVDVSSGVESAPGRKDAAMIEQFIHAAKAASTPKIRSSA